ncbi:VWA domain-containing protein [Fodinibius halophilus]|uniref:VWA domain-containing protein n=1 Tax=Fodinibius halophilus TaxID=1736908 RepID=A0A6M1SX32_9BACT|nr:VWA domain-containing protein [Fodinibius halophilus]NGP88448.1 VWA domain-containing protein [Fodinibius halophilus]
MKASKNSLAAIVILSLYVIILLTGCVNTANDNEEISVELIESKTELPSKIQLFYKVDLGEDNQFTTLEPSNFEIYEDGSKISSLEAQAQIQREPGDFLYSSVLMLDLSGSILNNADLPKLKEAATSFVKETMPRQTESLHGTREMALFWFDGEEYIHPLVSYTANRDTLISGIESIDEDISNDVSTNLNGAVIQGLSSMDARLREVKEDSDIATAGTMVLFTDGTDQAGYINTEVALDSVSNAADEHGVFTIGLGGEIDEGILKKMGKSGFELAEDSLELNDSFLNIAERLEAETNSFYVLEYCSPKRSGTHSLELRAVYEDKFGSFQTQFSAEEFSGGCEVE